jgi:hypothetical protein
MKGYKSKIQDAEETPFDNTNTNFTSDDVQGAIEETITLAEGVPRAFVSYWDWNSNPIYLYLFGQTRSNEVPFALATDATLRELSCSGDQNNTTASVIFAIYRTDGSEPSNFGTLPEVTNQDVTYKEGDLPYSGTSRVTIELVNNGSNLPLAFSEDLNTRTVTIQLETNGAGTPVTTKNDLRTDFRLNSDISLIYSINFTGSGSTVLNTANFNTSGGDAGDAIGTVFMRATNTGFREGYEVSIAQGEALIGRVLEEDQNSFSPVGMNAFLSFSSPGGSSVLASRPPYNDAFQAYDTTGGLTLTGSFQTLNLNNVDQNDGSFSYASGELTFNENGLYEIEADLTSYITSGSSRSETEFKLQENIGAGWIDVPALRTIYNRTSTQGSTTGSINLKRRFNSGDKLRVVCRQSSGGSTVETLPNGSSLSALYIKE